MKITAIKFWKVELPLREGRYSWSNGNFVEVFDSTVVAVETDAGITGYAECCPLGSAYLPAYALGVRSGLAELGPKMIGMDPRSLDMINRHMDAVLRGRPYVKAPIDIACWDILGKARNRPVWALLGGKMNRRVRSYTYLYPEPGEDAAEFWVNADMTAEAAARTVKQGFTAVKFDPAGPYTIRGGHEPAMTDISRSVEFCKKIREAVGDKADLLFGTHGQFTTPGAIRLGRELEPYNPLWYEEPIPPDNILEFAEVARHVRIPLATGERLTTKTEFGTLLRAGGVKILQPALGRLGGIMEAKKLSAIAEIFNAEMAPHLYAGPVEWAANIHLAVSIPNLLMAETIQKGGDFHLALIKHTLKWEDGYILPPEAPGLGIDFDEDLARAHAYTGTGEGHHDGSDSGPQHWAGCGFRQSASGLANKPPD